MIRFLRRLLSGYLISVGLVAHILPFAGVYWAMSHFGLSPGELVGKVHQKVEARVPWLAAMLAPSPRYTDHVMDGRLKVRHPRVLLSALAGRIGPGGLRARMDRYESVGIKAPRVADNCIARRPDKLAICWLTEGDDGAASQAIGLMAESRVGENRRERPVSIAGVGEAWRLALAYDLLHDHPDLHASQRALIEATLRDALSKTLEKLDGASLSLWHSRASISAEAWVLAVALGAGDASDGALVARAQGHFLAAVGALRLAEAWPEGYNYWINSRAFLFGLAASAYVNGLEGAERADQVAEAVRRAALWSVYAVRPDHRIEGIADEGPRTDQKDETRRFIDLVVQLTGDRVLSAYSRYLGARHGKESYYRSYRWAFPLLNDPSVRPAVPVGNGDLSALADHLPLAELFGRDVMNQAYIRSGWHDDATVIGFRAGATLTHHAHYDAGHFTIFKGAPLAVNSSLYGEFFAENRLNYAIRTVAKNSLLVLRPDERVRPNRFFADNVAAGGQRIVMPTGSAITGLADFRANQTAGKRLEAGRLRAYDYKAGAHAFISADISRAYDTPGYDRSGDGGKVVRAIRDLLYLYDDDVVVIHDDVETASPAYTKKWLLHTIARPEAEGLTVRKGQAENGILETSAGSLLVKNRRGRLHVQRFEPAEATTRVLGGPDYRFYVETDGDDSDLDGRNMVRGARDKPWFDNANWRIEIQPKQAGKRHRFLIGLVPSLDRARRDAVRRLKLTDGEMSALATDGAMILFPTETQSRDGEIRFVIPGYQSRLYVVGARPGTPITIEDQDGRQRSVTPTSPIAMVEGAFARGRIVRVRLGR